MPVAEARRLHVGAGQHGFLDAVLRALEEDML